MPRTDVLLLSLASLTALAACSATSTGSGPSTDAPADVPAGVVEQYRTLEAEVAERGGEQTVGEWDVAFIVERAEPWYAAHGGGQHFEEPAAGETHHIEIIPREAATGRIVPDVPISLEVLDADGKVVDEKELHFLYSTFFHYANNFEIPEGGEYTLRATLGEPTFHRHGERAKQPELAEGATVTFDNVELTSAS